MWIFAVWSYKNKKGRLCSFGLKLENLPFSRFIILFCQKKKKSSQFCQFLRLFKYYNHFSEVTFNVWSKRTAFHSNTRQNPPGYLWMTGENFDLWLLFPLSLSLYWGCSCDGETVREWIGHKVDIQWTGLAQDSGQHRNRGTLAVSRSLVRVVRYLKV